MKQVYLKVLFNEALTENVFRMRLKGDISGITSPGQFVNVRLDGLFLRRPISVCDVCGDELTLIYKRVGRGTAQMSLMKGGEELDVLTGLGNGYDLTVLKTGDRPLLIGGGVGVPPLYLLAKKLREQGFRPRVVLGFNRAPEVFYAEEFEKLGCEVTVATADGSLGIKGFVTDALPEQYDYVYCCGPEPMLKAVYRSTVTSGQYSFEERMGCGFGACMGCSCRTITGNKRICREGPVLRKEEILWED